MQMTIQQIKTAKSRSRRAAGTKGFSAFQEQDRLLQGWLAVSEEGIFVVQDGRIKECNHFLARLGGYLQDEVLDTVFASFFDGNSIAAVESACGGEFPGTRCGSAQTVSLVCKNGQRVNVQLKVQPCVFSEKPAMLAVLSRVLDSTHCGENGRAYDWLLASEKIPFGL
ncbi:MAG: PAS domain-containing protein [Deltaproteobacteria bacterium]|nr:PAS domain-containing protein [Deltaproteobacteria bacterium]